jgi:hypothetical protein
MKLITIFAILILSACTNKPMVFKGGHSHNDYWQPSPLFHALENKMVSIEADVYYRNGQLLVGHSEAELRRDVTLESLYLKPLAKAIKEKDFNPIILLIDIKDKSEETYFELKKTLDQYSDILTQYNNDKITYHAVTIILSGERPVEIVKNEQLRFVFLDGRFNQEDILSDAGVIPLISDSWNKFFTWKGIGDMPENEHELLVQMIEQCHSNNKMIRFWGIPDNPETNERIWEVLESAQVDLIGTDCPVCLKQFFNRKN